MKSFRLSVRILALLTPFGRSHDGRKIAFFYSFAFTHPSRNPEVWAMDPDGSNMKRLAEHGLSPSWSPDDGAIVFVSDREGEHPALSR